MTNADFQPSEPISADDGLPYIILERLDDVDKANTNEQRHSSFASLFLRRRKQQPNPNTENEESSVITTSMFVFGEEGRDLLSSEIAFRIIAIPMTI